MIDKMEKICLIRDNSWSSIVARAFVGGNCFRLMLFTKTINFGYFLTLNRHHMVRVFPSLQKRNELCTSCLVGKQHRALFVTSTCWGIGPLYLMHIDLCRCMRSNANWFLVFLAFCWWLLTTYMGKLFEDKGSSFSNLQRIQNLCVVRIWSSHLCPPLRLRVELCQ